MHDTSQSAVHWLSNCWMSDHAHAASSVSNYYYFRYRIKDRPIGQRVLARDRIQLLYLRCYSKMSHHAPCHWLPGRTYSSHSESHSHRQTSRGMTNDSPVELVLSSSSDDRAGKEKVSWMSILLAASSRLWQRRRRRDRWSDFHRTSTSSIHLQIQLRPSTTNPLFPTHWIAIPLKVETTTAKTPTRFHELQGMMGCLG